MERENRPLKGIVVACFSPSTPYSAVIVASQLQMVGATVTLILPSMENPSMAQDRSGLGGLTDRLKVIHLNLKTPQGREEACTLCGACEGADRGRLFREPLPVLGSTAQPQLLLLMREDHWSWASVLMAATAVQRCAVHLRQRSCVSA